ncbi:uncharacterized protein LOC114184552 [Vigna unguiculata]|uniref:uncharacterized protein LOC114184552 n=1 Tax=Vigna unguiculata TaxID=3917 RepID=UPI001016C9E8|nr:uncharacterized protein LOC114184552 [Vigna unguiculata]
MAEEEEGVSRKVVVRNRCKTDYIVKVNGLLRPSHRSRIGRTPFRWCVDMVKPLDINGVLLKHTLSRWVPEHESICIRQHLVRLSVLDVCVCLGLNAVGVDVEFNSVVCGVIKSLFEHEPITIDDIVNRIYFYLQSGDDNDIDNVDNVCRLYLLLCFALLYFPRTSRTVTNMPFRLLDNLDNLNQYNWSRSVHSFLVEGFNRAYHTLRQDQNTSTITVAGSVAIFLLLVCRLLSVGSYEGDVSFPRILSWPSLVIMTHGIKSAFESNKVVLEWELTEDEKNIDVVREALNVGSHGIPKKGVEDMSFTKFKQWCKRKLKRNYRVVQQLKDQLSNMEEEYACGGQEPDPSSFEEPEPSPFHNGHRFDVEEPQSRPFDHPSSSHQPQPSSFDKGHAFDVEEPQSRDFEDPSSFHQAEPSCHDIGDGCDVEEAQARHCNTPEYNPHGMEIIPYVEPGKCSLDVDLSELYRILVSQDGRQTVVDINHQILTTVECCGFRPRGKLSNMAILFAYNNFMYRQRKLNGVIKRVVFGTLYTTVVVEDSRRVKAKRREWVLGDYNNFLTRGLVSVHDILSADFVFAPIIHEQHWWCYVINCRTRQFFVLDSLGSKRQGHKRIDNAIARNMEILFGLLENCSDADKPKFEVLTQDLPPQPNL